MRAKIRQVKGGTVARTSISLDIGQKKYIAEYELDHGVLHVFFGGRSASSAVTSPSLELVARLLLVELIFQTPSWREPDTPSSDVFSMI
jgi:hypothetical protein